MQDSFSTAERRFVGPFRQGFARITSPLVRLLAALGVSPNAVSSSQIAVGVVILLLIGSAPGLAFALFIGTLLLDGLDGALARTTGRGSRFGALVDQISDHARETLMIAGLAVHGLLHPAPAVLYPLVYALFNFLLFLCNYRSAPVPWAIKSYLIVYPAFGLYAFGAISATWITPAVSVSIALMVVSILIALRNLSTALDPPR